MNPTLPITLAACALSLLACASGPHEPSEPASTAHARSSAAVPTPPKRRRHVEVQLYAMSMDPFAARFVRSLGALRESLDLDVRDRTVRVPRESPRAEPELADLDPGGAGRAPQLRQHHHVEHVRARAGG